ncbi:putative repeat protein (TIGR01451 family) [Actinokineospora cianjurensis]|uniref:Putative repeat protein (TIGR01451 family) n=2 Tax=Actinokineospora cianjurensis TaxID=585224 RepID=A0A421B1C4_9PSEU|nr:putative repeat protein (TIGR01451 family) [Actinokineospora cianjurensis]
MFKRKSPEAVDGPFPSTMTRRSGAKAAVVLLVLATLVSTGGPVLADPDPVDPAQVEITAEPTTESELSDPASPTPSTGDSPVDTQPVEEPPVESAPVDPVPPAETPSGEPQKEPAVEQAPVVEEAPGVQQEVGPRATVDLALSVYAAEAANAGAPVSWTLTVRNNGPGSASSFTVTDTLPISVTGAASPTAGCSVAGLLVSCAGGALAAGASATFRINATTPTPFTFPLVNNASVATGPTDSDSNTGNNEAVTVTTTAAPAPSVALLASASLNDTNGNGVGDIGENITYALEAHNQGNVTLFNLTVQHNGAGTVTCAATTLSLGQSTTCSAPAHVVNAADVTAGQVVTSSTASATAPDGELVASAPTVTNIPTFAAAPAIDLVRTANLIDTNGDTVGEAGEEIDYRFLVSNSGNVPLTGVVVTGDDLTGNPCAGVITTLQPNQTVECVRPTRYVITAQDAVNGSVAHTATVSGVAPSGATVTSAPSTSTTPTFVPAPALTISQTYTPGDENGDGRVEAGETVRFQATITNNGNVALSNVNVVIVTGAQSPSGCAPALVVQSGATAVCTQSIPYVVTPQDAAAGVVTRAVRARGTSAGGVVALSEPVTSSIPVFVPSPSIGLTHTAQLIDANGNGLGDLGELIQFSVTINNTGNVTLTDVIVEGVLSGNAETLCPQASMLPEASASCPRGLYTITQHDVEVGAVLGIGTAVGTAPNGTRVRSVPITVNIPVFDPAPVLGLVKDDILVDGNGNGLADAGEPINYTFAVTNVGNVTVTGLNIVDPLLTGTTCPKTTLIPQESTTCTSNAPHITTTADVAAAEVVNVATARGTAPDTSVVVSLESRTNTPTFVAVPGLALDKIAVLGDTNGNGLADLGENIQWSFLVVNNGTTPLFRLHIVDPVAGLVTCPITDLAVLAATTCVANAPHPVTESDILLGEVANTALAVADLGDAGQTEVVSPPDSTVTPTAGPNPGLTLSKRADLQDLNDNDLADKGEYINYSFVLTNTGNLTLTQIRVDDPKAGAVTCPVAILVPGASTTCTAAPYLVTGDDIAAGIVRNVAVGYGTPPVGPVVQTPPAIAEVPIAYPGLTLDKIATLDDVDEDGFASVGETIVYTFVLVNIGNVPMTDIQVDDPKAGVVTCPVTTLLPGETTTCSSEPYEVTEADVAIGVVHNEATASGQPPGTDPPYVTPPDTADVPTTEIVSGEDPNEAADAPAITLVKSAALRDTDGDDLADVGELIDYTFLVTNTGDVALSGIHVDDPKITDVVCPDTTLDPGESVTCAKLGYVVTQADVDSGTVHNVATASGDTGGGDTVTSLPSEANVPADDVVPGGGDAEEAEPAAQGGLAATGTTATVALFGWSLVFMVAGVLVLLGSRDRRKKA